MFLSKSYYYIKYSYYKFRKFLKTPFKLLLFIMIPKQNSVLDIVINSNSLKDSGMKAILEHTCKVAKVCGPIAKEILKCTK